MTTPFISTDLLDIAASGPYHNQSNLFPHGYWFGTVDGHFVTAPHGSEAEAIEQARLALANGTAAIIREFYLSSKVYDANVVFH